MANPELLSTLAPALRAFVARHALPDDAIRASGRLLLRIEQHRMQVVPAPHQRLALGAELLPLAPTPYPAENELLLRLSRTAAGLLQQHAATLCIDDAREALVLQQLLPAAVDYAGLERGLGEFANALAFWHRVCEAETHEFGA
jgi:hypothetical protein